MLMTILATDVFEDMRIIAENRYFSILTIGTRAHVQYGDANMYG